MNSLHIYSIILAAILMHEISSVHVFIRKPQVLKTEADQVDTCCWNIHYL